jgi:hypothetical protein
MIISEEDKVRKLLLQPVSIDWEMNMANYIAGKLLNNEKCKKNYARILALAALKIHDALRYENDNQ